VGDNSTYGTGRYGNSYNYARALSHIKRKYNNAYGTTSTDNGSTRDQVNTDYTTNIKCESDIDIYTSIHAYYRSNSYAHAGNPTYAHAGDQTHTQAKASLSDKQEALIRRTLVNSVCRRSPGAPTSPDLDPL
jgi:hypothetical protein